MLIADDQEVMRDVLRDLVAAAPGFELVAEAASGEQALAAARREQPMLALIDVHMPGIGGLEAARQLSRGADGPVVVLMSADPDDSIDARAYGAVMLMHKRDLRVGTLLALWRTHGARDP